MSEDLKVLFIHNSITWYRIPLFIEINKICNVRFVFSKVLKMNKNYKNITTEYGDLNGLNYVITPNWLGISWGSIREVINGDYDVVLVTVLDSIDQIFEAYLCTIIARLRKKKVAYFWERWDAPKEKMIFRRRVKAALYKLAFKLLYKHVDTFICSGSKSKEYFLENGVKESKITIASDASIVSEKKLVRDIKKELAINDDCKVILYFGRIERYKGLDILIKAFAKLNLKIKNSFLLVCGDGEFKEECINLANELKCNSIIFKGVIQPEERYDYFSASNIFVLPNKFDKGAVEVWGLSINEAMSVGIPVISTTANGAAYDMIKNGFNGYLIEEDNVEELNSVLEKMISNPKLTKIMGNNAKRYVEENFSYEKMALGFKNGFNRAFK